MAINSAQIIINNGNVQSFVQPIFPLVIINSGAVSSGGGGSVIDVSGTTNQIVSSPITGHVVLSLPSNVIFPGTWQIGTLGYVDTGILWSAQSTLNSYDQVIVQNTNNGNAASANYIISNDVGTATTFFGEFGMNSSGFTGSGSFALPSAVYLDSMSSDLVLGTLANKSIHFVVNSGATDAFTITGAGLLTVPAFNVAGVVHNSAAGVLSSSLIVSADVTPGTFWSLASGGTLTGVNTITSNAASQLLFNGTWTATANSQFNTNFSGTFTSRNTNSDILYGYQVTPTLTVNAGNPTGQSLIAFYIAPTYTGAVANWYNFYSTGGVAGNLILRHANTNTGVTAAALYQQACDTTLLNLYVTSSTYTSAGQITQASVVLSSNQNWVGHATAALSLWTNTTKRLNIDTNGLFAHTQSAQSGTNIFQTFTQAAHTGGVPTGLLWTGGALTGLTTATEDNDWLIDLSGSKTWVDGTVATQRDIWVKGRTYNKTTTSATFTNAYTFYVESPTAGTGVTITNNYAAGFFGGKVLMSNGNTMEFDPANNSLASNAGFSLTTQGSTRFHIGGTGSIDLTQGGQSVGWLPALWARAGNDTIITANSERATFIFGGLIADGGFNSGGTLAASTRTIQWLAGTVATQRDFYIRGNTYTGQAATAIFTNAYSLYVDPPVAGTNATITNSWALGLSGNIGFTGANPNILMTTGSSGSMTVGSSGNNSIRIMANGILSFATNNTGTANTLLGSFITTNNAGTASVATFTQIAGTGSVNTGFIYSGGAHTNLTASELLDWNINLARIVQFTGSTGFATQRAFLIQAPTYAFVSATGTITDAATAAITGAPVKGTNVALTNTHALLIQAGAVGAASNSYGLTVNAQTGATNNYVVQFLGGSATVVFRVADTGNATYSQNSQSVTNTFQSFTQGNHTGGSPRGVTFTFGAHTTLTATEAVDLFFGVNRTVQFAGSTGFFTQRAIVVDIPTYAFQSATGTITNATALTLKGAPIVGTNAAIINTIALSIEGGTTGAATNSYGALVNAQIGATNNYSAQFIGGLGLQVDKLRSAQSAATTIAAGTGAGTGPTVSLGGGDLGGFISITTGTTPTASATVVTITFSSTYGSAPRSIILTPANINAAPLNGNGQIYVDQASITATTFIIKSGSTGLTASTAYIWFYQVIQ